MLDPAFEQAWVRGVVEGESLWLPPADFLQGSELAKFMRWVEATRSLAFSSYADFWRWSVTELDAFWLAVWEYFDVESAAVPSAVRVGEMPHVRWFPGSRLNFAEHLLRHERRAEVGEIAMLHMSEVRPLQAISWHELGAAVRSFATYLRRVGVMPGDRVVAYLPNIPEAAIAMMATTAIGAIWSAASPDFGVQTVLARFAQIEPRILIATDGYRVGGQDVDRSAHVEMIAAGLPTLDRIVWIPYLNSAARAPHGPPNIAWNDALADPGPARDVFAYEHVDEHHPLWILFSSGTTGLPKAIVHSHVGMTVEMFKLTALSANLSPKSRMLFYTSSGWMMWNFLISGLLRGASIVLYDGHPAAPQPDVLWRLAERCKVTLFGCSPAYAQHLQKAGVVPKHSFDLSLLESIFLTGSPATPETFAWFYDCVKTDLWVTSQSGGTDFCSVLVGAVATQPVYAGEIQGRNLGMDVHAWNDRGESVIDEVGELVVTSPAPSMPLCFWNDPGDERYRESYFSMYPGVWRHGDFIKINARGGVYVYGRSDSTLNRFGVRIGTAEIYRCIERLDTVVDSLIVCIEAPDGGSFMPLFVKLSPGRTLDEATYDRILRQLRDDCSPQHVPDEIHAAPDIPYTLSGKKMEIPVRQILEGRAAEKVAARDAMRNPDSIEWFVQFRQSLLARASMLRSAAPETRRSTVRQRRAIRSAPHEPTIGSQPEILEVVAAVWSDVLGSESFENDTRWIDAGGDSVLMFQLAFGIERRLGKPISLEAMWAGMRPSDLIARLSNPLRGRATTARTVVLLPGLGGDEPNFVEFRKGLGADVHWFVPSYAPWYQLVNADDWFSATIEDIISQIRQSVHDQPFILVGYSFGGFVAHEVARRLVEAGDTVGFVGMLDTYLGSGPPQMNRGTAATSGGFRGLVRHIRTNGLANALAARAGYRIAALVYGSRRLLHAVARQPRRLPLSLAIAFWFHYQMTWFVRAELARKGKPGMLAASTTLFRSQSHEPDAAHDLGWGPHAPRLRVESVPGTHTSMILAPNAERLARKIREEIAAYL